MPLLIAEKQISLTPLQRRAAPYIMEHCDEAIFLTASKPTIEILELAREQGARVGAVTDSMISPPARNAGWVFTVHTRLDSFIESFLAAMSLVNVLPTAVSLQNPEETMCALKEREALWQKN